MSNTSKERSTLNQDIQLEQKLLHYRSELKKFQRIIHLQKKKLTSQEEELNSLKHTANNPTIAQLPNLPSNQSIGESLAGIYAYFAYSTLFPANPSEDTDEPCLVQGNFIIRNDASHPLTNPLVCLTFSKPELANLSGKINQNKKNYGSEYVTTDEDELAWNYLENHSLKKVRESGEYWLRPNKTQLLTKEDMAFNHFEVVLPFRGSPFSMQINGYIYGEEIPEGRRALNSIICNIT